MAELIQVPMESGGFLTVEVDARDAGIVKAARPGQITAEATQTFEAALASLVPGVTATISVTTRSSRRTSICIEYPELHATDVARLVHTKVTQRRPGQV